MSEQELQTGKFIVNVRYSCPLIMWGREGRKDEWIIYNGERPEFNQEINPCLVDGKYPYPHCSDASYQCNETGFVNIIEKYTPGRAQELGLE